MEWSKEVNKAEYLKHHLSRSLSPEQIDPSRITYERVVNAPNQLIEYWQCSGCKAEVDNALAQPAGQAAAQRSKDANAFRRFATGEG